MMTSFRPAGQPTYATAEESRDQIVELYRQAWALADETIETLGLDAIGHMPWWPPEPRHVTLHRILVALGGTRTSTF